MFQMMIQGLLTHYRNNSQHTLVCYQVSHHKHQPRVTANINDVDQNASSAPDSQNGNIACYNLNGNVSFTTGINAGDPVSFLGAEVVPSLTSVSTGSVKNPSPAVKSSTPTPDLPVFFELGEGYLFVFDYFEEMAVFTTATYPLNLPRPMPRTVIYSAPTAGNVTIQDSAATPKIIVLAPTATVWFNNLPINPNQPMPHFNIKKNFFDQTNPVSVADPLPWATCPFGSPDIRPYCGSGSAAGIECSNTQWP